VALTQGIIIAGRYALSERLGTGAMGEVWRAHDTRFESRSVAVKFLREDDTLHDDTRNRDRLVTRLAQQGARGPTTPAVVFDALTSALATTNGDGLRQKVTTAFGDGPIAVADVVALFDRLVTDPAFNENARMRAKLRRLFRDEANAVATLRHDNIVSIFDYGDHEGSPYLVMDYIEGRTLDQVIDKQQPLSQTRRLRLMEDLCAGLGAAHRRKLVHRDIKPANLIIDSTTNSLKILDFGVVRRLGTEATLGIVIGTFSYMSPEQTRAAATLDHRSDIFAVGLVFYELMSGKKAFPSGRGVGDLIARIQGSPPPLLRDLAPGTSPSIEDIINRAIAKQPDDRYQDLSVMGRDIARVRATVEAQETASVPRVFDDGDATMVMRRVARPGPTLPPVPTTPPKATEPIGPDAAITLPTKALRPPEDVINRPPPLPAPIPAAPPPSTPALGAPPVSIAAPTPVVPMPAITSPRVEAIIPPPVEAPAPPPVEAPASPPVEAPAPPPVEATTPPSVEATTPPRVDAKRPAQPFVPAGITRAGRNLWPLLGGIAAVLILAIGAMVMLRPGQGEQQTAGAADDSTPPAPTPPQPSAPTPSPTGQPQTADAAVAAVDPPTPASLRTVQIDIRPWARVRVVPAPPAEGQTAPQVPADAIYAPFTLDLAPGDYVLECENGGLNRAATFQLKVEGAEGRPQFFTRTMPGFNPTKIVDSLLAQD
jgi:serine/threonine-protein kinase